MNLPIETMARAACPETLTLKEFRYYPETREVHVVTEDGIFGCQLNLIHQDRFEQ